MFLRFFFAFLAFSFLPDWEWFQILRLRLDNQLRLKMWHEVGKWPTGSRGATLSLSSAHGTESSKRSVSKKNYRHLLHISVRARQQHEELTKPEFRKCAQPAIISVVPLNFIRHLFH